MSIEYEKTIRELDRPTKTRQEDKKAVRRREWTRPRDSEIQGRGYVRRMYI